MDNTADQVATDTIHRSRRQWVVFCKGRLSDGVSPTTLIDQMVADDYPADDARQILDEAARAQNRRARGVLGCSTILLIAGLAVTLPTLEAGVGIIWWGAILTGGIGVVYGLCCFVKRS